MFEEEIYCPNCLDTITSTNNVSFKCNNLDCSCPYHFKVFTNEKDAILCLDRTDSWKPKYIFKKKGFYLVCFYNLPIKTFIIKKLNDLLSNETLRLIELGISADKKESITIIESDGNRIDFLDDSSKLNTYCSEYCQTIRKNKNGNKFCEEFDNSQLNKILANELKTKWYYCWAGLIDYYSKIKVNNLDLAIVISGQLSTNDDLGNKELEKGMDVVNRKVGINIKDMKKVTSKIKKVTHSELEEIIIPEINKTARQISEIAEKSYIIKKKLNEDLFLEEIASYLEYSNKGLRNIYSINIVLKRIREYYKFENVLFYYTHNKYNQPYQQVNPKNGDSTDSHNQVLQINFIKQKNTALENITIIQLASKKHEILIKSLKERKIIDDLKNVYLVSCPLIGMNHGFFLFINPIPTDGFRYNKNLNKLEKDFLRRFCATVKDKLNNNLSFGLVLNRIGHELGNSVQSLISNEEAILDSYDDAVEVKSIAKSNIKELDKHSHYILNLKSSLAKSDKNTFIFSRKSIGKLIEEIVDILESEIESKNLSVKVEVFGINKIEMDVQELGRAFYNLMQNAIKYSFRNKYITIKGAEDKEENCYILKITNYGVGITENELELGLVFNEGYRGVLSIDRNRTGSGLGLAITKEIIENHNGNIMVSSSNYLKKEHDKEYYRDFIEPSIIEEEEQKVGYFTAFKIKLPYYQKDIKL